jgi:hypothetical protein
MSCALDHRRLRGAIAPDVRRALAMKGRATLSAQSSTAATSRLPLRAARKQIHAASN